MKKKFSESMIIGVGTDIIEIRRIQEAIERHGSRFLNRLFTEKEQKYCLKYKMADTHFAGRFAAKEAILKAIGEKLEAIDWKEMEVLNDETGRPEVHLSARLSKLIPKGKFFLSISHAQEYATATAILVITK